MPAYYIRWTLRPISLFCVRQKNSVMMFHEHRDCEPAGRRRLAFTVASEGLRASTDPSYNAIRVQAQRNWEWFVDRVEVPANCSLCSASKHAQLVQWLLLRRVMNRLIANVSATTVFVLLRGPVAGSSSRLRLFATQRESWAAANAKYLGDFNGNAEYCNLLRVVTVKCDSCTC
jgi:hypothetical protein